MARAKKKKDMKLTEKECFDLEKIHLETEIKKRDIKIADLKLSVQGQKEKLLQSQIREAVLQSQLIKSHRGNLEKEVKGLSSERDGVIQEVKDRLDIKGAITFEPDTLEVIPLDETNDKEEE